MKCMYAFKGAKCPGDAVHLVKITLQSIGHSKNRADFIPGIAVCGSHTPDAAQIGPKMIEAICGELDKLGGKRPYSTSISVIPINGEEARAYFARKGN